MNQARVTQLLERAKVQGLEAVVIMPGPNMYYLTGLELHVSERAIMLFLPVDGEPYALCPAFEVERIRLGTGVRHVFAWKDEEGPISALADAVSTMRLGHGVLGIEYRYMRVLERELLAQVISECRTKLTSTDKILCYQDIGVTLADLRMVKDQEELKWMQQAAAIADAGVKAAHEFIRSGVTERQVAVYMEQELQKLGAEPPFHISVASGPRSAIPHSITSDRLLQKGELVWVDFVCQYQGYAGDITRTFPVGHVTGQLAEIFEVCLQAQAKARAESRAGMTGAQVDAIARDFITARGYGQYFTHRTGHGLGIEVHEEPYIVGSNRRVLEAGNTFTIEPGIYIPGLGGVRIEDDVVLEESGARSLTQYPRNLLQQ